MSRATGSGSRRRLGAWAAKRVAYHSGVLALARRARRGDRAMILRYHALTPGGAVDYAVPDICMPVEAFRLQMAFVQRAYRVVSIDELVRAVRGEAMLPAASVAITFDDGYADNHTLAAPVLQRFGLPAAVYVATGSIEDASPFWVAAVRVLARRAADVLEVPGIEPVRVSTAEERERAARTIAGALVTVEATERRDRLTAAATRAGVDLSGALRGTMLTRAQIRELHERGWVIGAHTVTHSNVAQIGEEAARREIEESRDALTDVVGAPVRHFCYPNTGGRHAYFDSASAQTLARAGFSSAVTSEPGAVHRGANPLCLPRLGVSPRLAPVVELATALERQRLVA